MMSLEEAIEHARETARTVPCIGCAEDHEQLAKWLEELKLYREILYQIRKLSMSNEEE